ncbi:hypothetical protein [Pseudomonas phage D6]|nr:hypothetical protein [Pseudomonas phage D6]
MGVKLIKRDNVWLTEFLGKERHFIIETDLVTWRSMGIHPSGAVEFQVDLDGTLNSVRSIYTGEEISELDIPKMHSVAGMIKATKPYMGARC